MTITVELRPEVRAEIARRAASHGREVEAYAASLLEDAVDLPATASRGARTQRREGAKSLVEVCAMVKGMTDDLDFNRNPSTDRPVEL